MEVLGCSWNFVNKGNFGEYEIVVFKKVRSCIEIVGYREGFGVYFRFVWEVIG